MSWLPYILLAISLIFGFKCLPYAKKKTFQEQVYAVMKEIYFSEHLTFGEVSFLATVDIAIDLCTGKRKPENYKGWNDVLLRELGLAYPNNYHYFSYLCALQYASELYPDDPDRSKIERHCSSLHTLSRGF